MAYAVAGGALMQSNLGEHGNNFEAVVFAKLRGDEPPMLVHYWRDTTRPDRVWTEGRVISSVAIDAGCIIQSNFGSPGNFEVVVPEPDGLAHYWHDNADVTSPFIRSATIAPGSIGPGSMVQNRENGNLEVVVRHGSELHHYWRDHSGWRHGGIVTARATGPACLIQSTYWDNLELVVLEGAELVHYWRDESETPIMKWRFGAVITTQATGPAGFCQGTFGDAPNTNFEVVVPEGDRLALYFRDNTDGNLPWYPGGLVTRGAGPIDAATLIQSSFDRNLEVLAQENGDTVYHYYRYWHGSQLRWFRGACLRVRELDTPDTNSAEVRSTKVVQLTGQTDHQRHIPAHNRTEERFAIRGTDLGASFRHRDRIYFWFGDTHWTNSLQGTLDSVASTSDTDAASGLNLEFHRAYPQIVNPSVSQTEYDVPLDGFSFDDQLYAFFTTDHFVHRKVMAKSVLTRCNDRQLDFHGSTAANPLPFQYLTAFSEMKFINISVERVGAEVIRAHRLPGTHDGLLIWGTGAYRCDNMYLAFVALDDPRTRDRFFASQPFPLNQLRVQYFTGIAAGAPTWSLYEADAVPLFYPAAIGELSVRWDPVLSRWVCLYMSGPYDHQVGLSVLMRVSRTPWGPWSRRRVILDWPLDALGKRKDGAGKRIRDGWFIHDADVSAVEGGDDGLGDDIIGNRVGGGGGAYAPYQLPHYSRQTKDGVVFYYVLSTWNPYQVVQMRHAVPPGTIERLERPR